MESTEKREKTETDEARLDLFPAVVVGLHGKPLYRVVEGHIRDLISSGQLIPGNLIPSETQLAQHINVSPGTVKKAIDNLVREGLLYRHQGKGTYVSRVNFENSLSRFFSYGDAKGRPVCIPKETTHRARLKGPAEICRRLNVPRGTKLVYIERVGYDRDTPILVEYSWWPAELVPGLEDERLHIPDYFYALILDQFGIPIIRAEETLTADAADEHTAGMIGIEQGTPVVVVKRSTFTRGDRIVEVRTTKGRADRFSYKAEIR